MKSTYPAIFMLVFIGVALGFVAIFFDVVLEDDEHVTSYEECVEAGYPVLESFPEQCRDDKGETFVRELSEEEREAMQQQDFYGSSTFATCETNDDCVVSGCNAEICQGADEESFASICAVPDMPLPQDVGYACECLAGGCQWGQ